jgi:hypothetical protein
MGSLSDPLKAFELVLTFRKIEELVLQKLSPKRKKTDSKLPPKSEETHYKLSSVADLAVGDPATATPSKKYVIKKYFSVFIINVAQNN